MRVTLNQYTVDPVAAIGEHAAICYDADTSREANIRRAAKCKDAGHLATLRFAYATMTIEGISRVCSHQLVRIAHAGILQQSQRYVALTNIEYVDPPALEDVPLHLRKRWYMVQDEAAELYRLMIEDKHMRKEDARYILPQSCTTTVKLCMNFQGWRDLLKNRDDKAAQWEIRDVAAEIRMHLHSIAPEIF